MTLLDGGDRLFLRPLATHWRPRMGHIDGATDGLSAIPSVGGPAVTLRKRLWCPTKGSSANTTAAECLLVFTNAHATAHLAPPPTHDIATAHTDATSAKVSSCCTVARPTSKVDLAAPKDAASPNVSSAKMVAGAAYTVATAAPKDIISPIFPPGVGLSAQQTRWSPRPPKTDPPPRSLSRRNLCLYRQLGDPRRPHSRR